MRSVGPGALRVIAGLALAVSAGVVSYFLTDLKSILSFVAGLQVTLITLHVEALIRERRAGSVATRQGRLMSSIERLDWMPRLVERIAQSSVVVQQRYPNTAATLASRHLLEDCANELSRLELGHLFFDYEDISQLLENAGRAQVSIRSTSLQSVDLRWWLSPLGRKYWQVLLSAIARGVHCERIFIYSDWTEDLNRLADEQLAAGVHVLRVRLDDLSPHLRRDIIVWDERCAYETRLNDRGEGQRNFFTFQPEEISRMVFTYNSIYSCATDLKEENLSCPLH